MDDGPRSHCKQFRPERDGFCESKGYNSILCVFLMLSLQEDIDLLALSLLHQHQHQKQQAQGLSLKAVYRDTVVGIRYLYSRDTITVPVCQDLAYAYHHHMHGFPGASTLSDNLLVVLCGIGVYRCHSYYLSLQS